MVRLYPKVHSPAPVAAETAGRLYRLGTHLEQQTVGMLLHKGPLGCGLQLLEHTDHQTPPTQLPHHPKL
jgi:hypothetical protein